MGWGVGWGSKGQGSVGKGAVDLTDDLLELGIGGSLFAHLGQHRCEPLLRHLVDERIRYLELRRERPHQSFLQFSVGVGLQPQLLVLLDALA